MNKIKALVFVGFALVGAASLAAGKVATIKEVNQAVEQLLAPMNDANTFVQLKFTNLLIDQSVARHLGLNALLKKIGKNNQLVLELNPLKYVNQGAPRLELSGRFELDLVKAFSQKLIDEMAPLADELIRDVSEDYTKKYQNALTLDAKIDQLVKDQKGHVSMIRFHVDAQVDLSRLPQDLTIKDVEFVQARFYAEVSRQGGRASMILDLNPVYRGFDSDQAGLKEWIEGLQNKNSKIYENIKMVMTYVNDGANWLVNKEPDKD